MVAESQSLWALYALLSSPQLRRKILENLARIVKSGRKGLITLDFKAMLPTFALPTPLFCVSWRERCANDRQVGETGLNYC